ncbi:hypothetical protein CRV15_00830 [Streptomyces clavuligerus]|uniref:hypothetical protein n=1 Tax=Streptomyces clavuligerus TaxID=1901 RepID=UPI00020D9464|nr:hypothetical protein [Streptomyces clavuligerus]AXU11388.1 hypothetical protein D1794_00830 [Streptomyces clavuligerus]QCS04259.1 hypothetical protein CRV15_00830 [Streptomyces clavuligerus]QPL61521.1 hypothetical protein I3J04_00725 [Streptomyces clavuligerus]QPL73630.1 hypothetical protein I3J06_00735 [Streptomyces clavuligerus]QPL79661.1 hypothetical protein I3J07_00780 [Streptomyces clavuligerus]
MAERLAAAGLSTPQAPRPGSRPGEFCTVEATHPDGWPEGAAFCVEVTHFPEAAYRWRFGQEDPPGAAEHRAERLRTVADALRGFGYTVETVERGGWRPGQRALRVHRPAGDAPGR